jgi:ubiquinone/menaquinone biosynthesis C-methylase UbiE
MGSILAEWLDRISYKAIRRFIETPRRLLADFVDEGMTVLDVGCGAGYYSLGMADLVGAEGRVVAVDTQATVIARLRQKISATDVGARIDARVCSDHGLEIDDLAGSVDFALAIYVLHHARDAAALMSGVSRALRRGAKFLVIEPRHHASAAERDVVISTARNSGFILRDDRALIRDWAATFVKE